MTIRDAFRQQSKNCVHLGSPFMGRLMLLLAERLEPGTPVADRVLGWTGNPFPHADSVPLRLAGGLHHLRITGRALDEVYPGNEVHDDALWSAVSQALEEHESALLDSLSRAPQTNEIRRSVAILPALHTVADLWGHPLEVLEIGCSGGLNLRADQFAVIAGDKTLGTSTSGVVLEPEWSGSRPAPVPLSVVRRAGVDLSPIDATSPEGGARLLSYLWPDQPERLERTRAAIEIARRLPATLAQNDAGAWLAAELASPAVERGRFVYHTIAAQYFSPETKKLVDQSFASAGGQATKSTPLARFEMEADGGRGAAMHLTLWPGGERHRVGSVDFHGHWIEWAGLP